MENTRVFKALDYFMLRVPLLPLTFYQEIFKHEGKNSTELITTTMEKLVSLTRDPLIREVIGSTSLSLLQSLDKLAEQPKGKQVALSFIKYLIRMSTRATPFGMLAGVTAGTFGWKSKVQLDHLSCYRTRTRPDMEWLMGFVSQLEQRQDVIAQVHVRANSAILPLGNRLEIPYISQYGQEKETQDYKGMESISIRATAVVLYTLEQGKEGIVFQELVSKVQQAYPETPVAKIKNFVWQLFQSQFLISELRPPLMLTDVLSPLEYVIRKLENLEGVEPEQRQLAEINRLLTTYDQQVVGQGGGIFLEAINKMNAINKSKNPLQTDLALSSRTTVLTRKVGEELAQAAECLWRLSPDLSSTPALAAYRDEFIEKYGVYREVPVLELLDADLGLGAPSTYQFPPSRRETKTVKDAGKVTKLERFLLEQIPMAIKNKETKVQLTLPKVRELELIPTKDAQPPTSLELYCSIIAPSLKALDDGDYEIVLGSNTGSTGAGKTFGRFLDILPQECREQAYHINGLEKKHLRSETITAELVYMPYGGRSANVVISQNIRDYEIAIATNSSKGDKATLGVDDLLIGVTNNHFYVKSKSLNKAVVVTTGHMLTTLHAPNVYRFLLEACQDGVRNWSPLNLGKVAEFPYVPRILFEKVILSPALWKLDWQLLKGQKDQVTMAEFPQLIRKWRKEWQVPQFVFLTEFDNRILLDLEHPLHVEILFAELRHKPTDFKATLVEMPGEFTHHWLRGNKGSYLEEIVVPLISNQPLRAPIHNKRPTLAPVPRNLRIKYPGSEWLYVKLYGNSNREEEFIAFALRDFCHKVLHEQQLIEEWFFIRYADPQPHIRLRFRGNPQVLTSQLLPIIHEWWCQLTQDGLLTRGVVDTYEREIERYGGPDLISAMESLFYWDSVVASDLLFIKRAGELSVDLEVIGVVGIIHFLTSMGWDVAQQIAWFDAIIAPKAYLATFHKHRKLYMQLSDPTDNWQNLRQQRHGEYIYNSLVQRGQKAKVVGQGMKLLGAQQGLFNNEQDIIGSLLHMFCNRLFGIEREKEKTMLAVTRHTLYNLQQFQHFGKKVTATPKK